MFIDIRKVRLAQKFRRNGYSPLAYLGGKTSMAKKLVPLFPKHEIYVEPFGGSAGLLFAKEPSKLEVYNDLNSHVVSFFRVLRSRKKFWEFRRLITLTPYSEEEFRRHVAKRNGFHSDVWNAYNYFILNRMSFSGNTNDFKLIGISQYFYSTGLLFDAYKRLQRVIILNRDFAKVLKRYDSPKTFFYLDPPYVPSTVCGKLYEKSMSFFSHRNLVNILKNIKGKVMLSCYYHPVYNVLVESGWYRLDFRVFASMCKGNHPKRVETVLLNYNVWDKFVY